MMTFSKKMVTLIIVLNMLAFVVLVWAFVQTNGSEPTVLTGSWFSFTTVQLWLLADIRKKKMIHAKKEEDNAS